MTRQTRQGWVIQPPLQRFELAELYRLANPGRTYLGDPPEAWTAQTLLAQLRARLAEARGGTRAEAGEAIRDRDEQIAVPARRWVTLACELIGGYLDGQGGDDGGQPGR